MDKLKYKKPDGTWGEIVGNTPTITATKNGTTTTILSDGVAIANIQDGQNGNDGNDADPLTITSQSLDDNGNRVVVFSDGTSVTIPKGQKGDPGRDGVNGTNGTNGTNGQDGRDGVDGYTPIKGTDYFTESDKQELINSILQTELIDNNYV